MSADPGQERLVQLLSRTALADRAAFEQLYTATRAKLFGVSLRIVRERFLAEEVLQDSFVSIWTHASEYARAKSAPLTWLTAIVRNRSLDVVRRAREEPDIDDALALALADPGAAPEGAAHQRSQARQVRACLEALEPEQRQSIALAFFQGLSHAELARHIGRPLGTVKTHIRRGLMRMRDCLAHAAVTGD